MPRIVRNFWFIAEVDGRRTRLSAGPRAKHGGFRLKIFQRQDGLVSEPLVLTGQCFGEDIALEVTDPVAPNAVRYRRVTRR